MKTGYIIMFVAAISLMLGQPSHAQNSGPIFIAPSQQTTQTPSANTMPTVVSPPARNTNAQQRPTQAAIQALSGMRRQSNPGYEFKELRNPYEGTIFGRIRTEKDYYDPVTQRKVNQYDYMKLLSDRGEQAKLAQVRSYLQKNGVFNPEKYRQVMSGGGAAAASNTTQNNNRQANPVSAVNRPQTITRQKKDESNMPQRIHQGYDDQPDPANTMKNRPIFLR